MVSDIRQGFPAPHPRIYLYSAMHFSLQLGFRPPHCFYLIEGVGQPLRQFSNDALNNALVVNGQLMLSTSTIFTSSVTNSFLYTSNGTLAGTTHLFRTFLGHSAILLLPMENCSFRINSTTMLGENCGEAMVRVLVRLLSCR